LPYSLALRLRDARIASDVACEYVGVDEAMLDDFYETAEAKLASALSGSAEGAGDAPSQPSSNNSGGAALGAAVLAETDELTHAPEPLTDGAARNEATLLWRLATLVVRTFPVVFRLLRQSLAERDGVKRAELRRDAAELMRGAAILVWDGVKIVANWLHSVSVPILGVCAVVLGLMVSKPVMQYAAIPVGELIFNILLAGWLSLAFRRVVRQVTATEGISIVSFLVLAGIGVAVTCLLIFGAVQILVALAQHDFTITMQPAQSALLVKDLYAKGVYQIVDAVPILNIPDTIGFDDPIPHPAVVGGTVLLALKLAVIVFVAGLFRRLWLAARTIPGTKGQFVDGGESARATNAEHPVEPQIGSDRGQRAEAQR
jgi:hypothetical protein